MEQRFFFLEALFFLYSLKSKKFLDEHGELRLQRNLDQMKEELNTLRTTGRAEIAHAIAEAREKGDLKENAEYDAAKEAQGLHEARIAPLKEYSHGPHLEAKDVDTSKVSVLSKVKLTNLTTKKPVEYQIVSEKEADLKLGKISVSSPIGKGLLGKAPGEVAEIQVPAGTLKFRVESISV